MSKKSTEKELLKQEISFLKEQVKKLKIDKLNQRIIYEKEKYNPKIVYKNSINPS